MRRKSFNTEDTEEERRGHTARIQSETPTGRFIPQNLQDGAAVAFLF
jgi:hypothetical protein